jgi:hypothetical protein
VQVLYYLAIAACLLLIFGLWLMRGVFGRWTGSRNIARALRRLPDDRPALERQFFEVAASSGKPRGLTWKSCEFDDVALLARDRATADLYALVRVTIAFEATPAGGMEEVEAVGNLRCATALFEWRANAWTSQGRAMFNLEPHEAIEHYRKMLEPIECDIRMTKKA